MYTPWGPSQYIETINNGIMQVHTAGHGGIMLSRDKAGLLPPGLESFSGWQTAWEEDCDWAIPFIIFYDEFDNWEPCKAKGKPEILRFAIDTIQYNKNNVKILEPFIEKIQRKLIKETK